MRRVLLTALIGGLVLKAAISALESKFVFFPYKGEDQTPAALGIPYREVRLTTSDGERLAAWQLESEHPRADLVYFHGNGGNLSVWLPVLAALHHHRFRVLAVDYRGYGLSSGSPTEEGVYRDAEAAARHVERLRSPRPSWPLVFWGRSLGGPVAASALRWVAPDGVILESTFPDKAAVAATQPMLRVLNVFAAYRFPTLELMRGYTGPVLVLHGDRDSIVPFELGRRLYDRLSGPKRFVAVSGADHNDFFDPSAERYWQPVLDFVAALKQDADRGV
jgi:pimeloyl-ACP methyl ester carboxylesterase